jgi:hypothetical protein
MSRVIQVTPFPYAQFLLALAFCGITAIGAPQANLVLDVQVLNQAAQPMPSVPVALNSGVQAFPTQQTNPQGHARFVNLPPGTYSISVSKEGFETVSKADIHLASGAPVSVELVLIPSLARKESIEVKGEAPSVEQGATTSNDISGKAVKELPGRPATVSDALPLIPGVIRAPGGTLQISGSGEHRSALIVNSADVTDPSTGQFGLTVPMDSVETIQVFQTPFLAQYGKFSAGLVSVETKRGGDKWKWELNDPFPEFRIRSWHLRGLRDATPRINFSGPLLPGKLYFTEGAEYEIRKTAIYTLPFPNNQKKKEGINSFSQLDWVKSEKHLVTATVHIAPQRLEFVNMNYFNPQPTTPDAGTHNYTGTVSDHLSWHGGLLDNTLSLTRFDAKVWAKGPADLIITPGGNRGNYSANQNRDAMRAGLSSNFSFAAFNRGGDHSIKIGYYVADSLDRGEITRHPINILNAQQQLLERIFFIGGSPFSKTDIEYSMFAQDHWVITPHLALDYGVRGESQQRSQAFRLAPRGGLSWSPFAKTGTVIRGGYGLFYDRVPLNVYSFDKYPAPVITMYDTAGQVSGGPFVYRRGLGTVLSRSPFVFQEPVDGNFSPSTDTWSVQVEQPVSTFLRLRVGYQQNRSDGLVVLNPSEPDSTTNTGTYLLTGTGKSRYRQFELSARVRMRAERQIFLSYVSSSARGDLNDFNNYLGSFPAPIVRRNRFGDLPSDMPHRFLAWGVLPLPHKFTVSPIVELRNGFPYLETNAIQNYAGVPYSSRFPVFFSADARVSKDFKVSKQYSIRLSVSGFNLTNHFNPEAVHGNTGDPAFGYFFGHRGRRFTADFDFLF